MNVSHTIPDDIKHFQQAEPNIILITQTGNLKFASGYYISPVVTKRWPSNFFLILSPDDQIWDHNNKDVLLL